MTVFFCGRHFDLFGGKTEKQNIIEDMVKGKNAIFGKKDQKESHDKSGGKENAATENSTNSTENMAGSNLDETAEMSEGKNISGQETDSVISKEQELQAKVDELQDKYMRLMAEFDNFRRRTMKERMEIIKTAGEDILVSILPVMDDFERGLKAMQNTQEVEPVKQGVDLIYSKFKEFLIQRGVKEIDSINQEFNVDLHEALTKIPAPEQDLKGKVVDVIQKGYYLNDKVIRYAKVIVGE